MGNIYIKANKHLMKKGAFMQKHPQNKEELKKLQPLIEEQLLTIGTSSSQMRQIANNLKINTGLVVKTKASMVYRNLLVPSAPVATDPAVVEEKPVEDVVAETVEEPVVEVKKRKTRVSLTPQQEIELCDHYAKKEFNQEELAELYGISHSSVSRIVNKHNLGKGNDMKGKKKITRNRQRNNKENIAAKKSAVVESNAEINDNNDNDRLYPEEGGKNPNEPFVTVKFVTHFPIFSKEVNSKDTIWCVSKNGDPDDFREDVRIYDKKDSKVINEYRNRYDMISIINGEIHLIDYWDISENKLVLYANKEHYMFYKEDDSHISYDELLDIIKNIKKYDATINRSRLKLNEFEYDVNKFGSLAKTFGLNKFSFNYASKNNAVTVEAGLIADRHEGIPVDKFIYDSSFDEDLMFNYVEQERLARKFLTENFDFSDDSKVKQLKLYLTGLQAPYGEVIKLCVEMNINLIAMHYNAKTKSYVPQYVNGNVEDTGGYIKAFDKLRQQKTLANDILLFNCTYEDFMETNIDCFYIMELAKMRSMSPTDNQKAESIIIVIKDKNDIWKIYPTLVDHINDNTGLNLALWVTDAKIKDNTMHWGMNIVKSFNYK